MKKLHKVQAAAENKYDEQLAELVDKVEDNTSFVVSGIEMLGRRGAYSDAISLAQELNDTLNGFIDRLGSTISE